VNHQCVVDASDKVVPLLHLAGSLESVDFNFLSLLGGQTIVDSWKKRLNHYLQKDRTEGLIGFIQHVPENVEPLGTNLFSTKSGINFTVLSSPPALAASPWVGVFDADIDLFVCFPSCIIVVACLAYWQVRSAFTHHSLPLDETASKYWVSRSRNDQFFEIPCFKNSVFEDQESLSKSTKNDDFFSRGCAPHQGDGNEAKKEKNKKSFW